MAERNIADDKRFVFRSPNKKPATRLVPEKRTKSRISSKVIQPSTGASQTRVDTDTPRTETTPVRRVIVVRNSNNPRVKQRLTDVSDLEQSDPGKTPPVITNGVSILFLDEIVRFIHERIF